MIISRGVSGHRNMVGAIFTAVAVGVGVADDAFELGTGVGAVDDTGVDDEGERAGLFTKPKSSSCLISSAVL